MAETPANFNSIWRRRERKNVYAIHRCLLKCFAFIWLNQADFINIVLYKVPIDSMFIIFTFKYFVLLDFECYIIALSYF